MTPAEIDALVRSLRNNALPDPYDEREVMHAPLLRSAANTIETLRADLAAARALLAAVEWLEHGSAGYYELDTELRNAGLI